MKRPGNASAFPVGERCQGPRHRPFVNAAVRPRHWLVGRSEPIERLPSMKLTSARTGLFLAISALLAPASALAQQAQAEPQAPATEQAARSEEHTSELQSLMRISYAVFCLKKKK